MKLPLDLLIINEKMMFSSSLSMICIGPLSIASYIDSKGFSVRIIDNNSQYKHYTSSRYLKFININKSSILGMGINLMNAYPSYELIKKIRHEFPNLIIIGGGMHTYDCSYEMLEYGFDIVFKGEAEISLTRFMQLVNNSNVNSEREIFRGKDFISELRKIQGLLFKDGDEIVDTGTALLISDLDELPFLNYDLVNLGDFVKGKYDHFKVTNSVNFQRGCPYQCTFCKADFMKGKIRNNSSKYMIRQLEILYDKYGVNQFNIQDANFTIDKKRIHDFCNLMISSGLSKKISLWFHTAVSIPLNNEELEMLREAGVTTIAIGIERFDDDFRKLMKKAGSTEKAIKVLKDIKVHNMKTMVQILINFPCETKEALKREYSYLERYLSYVDYYGIHYLQPVPGTEIYYKNNYCYRWYLRPEILNKSLSYYDIAYNVTSISLEFNLFQLPDDILKELRLFKERFYRESISKMDKSLFFKTAFLIDMFFAKISYYIYQISPRLEDIIFVPLKYLRIKGGKFFMNKFVMKAEECEN